MHVSYVRLSPLRALLTSESYTSATNTNLVWNSTTVRKYTKYVYTDEPTATYRRVIPYSLSFVSSFSSSFPCKHACLRFFVFLFNQLHAYKNLEYTNLSSRSFVIIIVISKLANCPNLVYLGISLSINRFRSSSEIDSYPQFCHLRHYT